MNKNDAVCIDRQLKGSICINKQLIEKEVKFYNDLVLSVLSVNVANSRHKDVKKAIIDSLPASAADSIYETLRLDDLSKKYTESKGDFAREKRLNDMLLDCTVSEFYNDPNAREKESDKKRNRKITPCGTKAKKRINGVTPTPRLVSNLAKSVEEDKFNELLKIIEKDDEKYENLKKTINESSNLKASDTTVLDGEAGLNPKAKKKAAKKKPTKKKSVNKKKLVKKKVVNKKKPSKRKKTKRSVEIKTPKK